MTKFKSYLPTLFIVFSLIAAACSDDDEEKEPVVVPETYSFERNGQTSVSYAGQEARINQLSEIKAYLKKGDSKTITLNADVLSAMYANTGGNGSGNFTFSAEGKQLRDKTFAADVAYFDNLLTKAAQTSAANVTASEGVAGFLTRSSGSTMLVDENGKEFTQVFEKGIMGSVFLNQIYNTYLTDEKTGDGVENTALDGSNNYTLMEHHWDEAFGYFGVPVDFPTTLANRFWGSYSNEMDALLGSNEELMEAFKTGRAAIVAKRYDVKNEQRDILYNKFELLNAAIAIHYMNETKTNFSVGHSTDAFHTLSEGYGFLRGLRLSPKKKITDAQLTSIMTLIGENFWAIDENDLSRFDEVKDILVAAYPDLASIKDEL
jgi:hypothetical protein